jgi:hypothetical protein
MPQFTTLEHLQAVREELDKLMKHPNGGRLAVIENKLGENVYLDFISLHLDRAIKNLKEEQ